MVSIQSSFRSIRPPTKTLVRWSDYPEQDKRQLVCVAEKEGLYDPGGHSSGQNTTYLDASWAMRISWERHKDHWYLWKVSQLSLNLSMSLTAKQIAYFSQLGNYVHNRITGLVAVCFWYGVFLLLIMIHWIVQHTSRPQEQRALTHKILFGATVFGFLIATISFGCRIAGLSIEIDGVFVSNESFSRFLHTRLASQSNVASWTGFAPSLIADGFVIWGASVLCRAWFYDKLWVIAFPCLLWLGTLGTILTYLIWLSTPSGHKLAATQLAPNPINDLLTAGTALSSATNLVSTLLFGWTLWHLRRGELGTRPTPVKNLLTLVIESGTVYFVIQLLYLALTVKTPSTTAGSIFFAVVAATYNMVSTMYPTIILTLRVLCPSSEVILNSYLVSKMPLPSNLDAVREHESENSRNHVLDIGNGAVNIPAMATVARSRST